MDNISKASYAVDFIFGLLFCKRKKTAIKNGSVTMPALYYLRHYC